MSTSPSSTETINQKIRRLLKIEKPWLHKVVKCTWIVFFCFIVGFPLYVFTVSVDPLGLYGPMPTYTDIENPQNDLSSELISADGVSLGGYFRYNRSQVTFDELSDELKNTLLISEGWRKYPHPAACQEPLHDES